MTGYVDWLILKKLINGKRTRKREQKPTIDQNILYEPKNILLAGLLSQMER